MIYFLRHLYLAIGLVVLVALLGCESSPKNSHKLQSYFDESIQCIGKLSAPNRAVYLHGFTGESWNRQEQKNIAQLKKLSRFLNIRMAIPRSQDGCLHNGSVQRCWGVDMTRNQAQRAVQAVKRAADKCFPDKADYGVIGFSNGGYIANKIFGYCLAPSEANELRWMVSVGAARLWGEGFSNRNLKSCRSLTLVAGKRDRYNYEYRQKKFRKLQSRGAKISILIFDGGHELPFGPMVTALRGYQNK